MLKKLKSIITKKIIIIPVILACFSLSAVVIAGSVVKNDDMEYSVNIVDAEGNSIENLNMPVGIGIRGDADSDNKVSVRDASQIARYLANSSTNKNYMPGYKDSLGGAMGDANADGTLNVRDAAKIAGYLSKIFSDPDAGWD